MVSFTQWSVDYIISKPWHVLAYTHTTALNTPATRIKQQTLKYTNTLQNFKFIFFLLSILFLPLSQLCISVYVCICAFFSFRKISKYFNNRIRLFSFNTISLPHVYTNMNRTKDAIRIDKTDASFAPLFSVHGNIFHISTFYCTVLNAYIYFFLY